MSSFKKSFFTLAALTCASTTIAPQIAHAQSGIYSAGEPESYNLPTQEVFGFPDIYQRQLNYRDHAIKLREQIKERQENFQAPALEARTKYEQDLKNLNNIRGDHKYNQ
ncbi:MAG: hypothetical protein KTR28_05540 [Micavibrio sp.]|nr:hypothetical protein [Micavibrio sp.]